MIAFDQHAHIDSVIHRRDARSKVIAFLIPIFLIASTPREQVWPYPFYFALLALLVLLSRVPLAHILWRCAAASPFILMAAGFLLITRAHESPIPALAVALKAYACVALMALLTSTSRFHEILRAMRSLGSPRALNLVASLMFRYMFLLQEEYQRMTRARESRTALPVRSGRYGLYARQLALLFIRSWERAERIHAAMLARGFKDTLKVDSGDRLRIADLLFASACCAAFLMSRFSHVVIQG